MQRNLLYSLFFLFSLGFFSKAAAQDTMPRFEVGSIYFLNGLGLNFYGDYVLGGESPMFLGAYYEATSELDFLFPDDEEAYTAWGVNVGTYFGYNNRWAGYLSPGYDTTGKDFALGLGLKYAAADWLVINTKLSDAFDTASYGLGVGIRF